MHMKVILFFYKGYREYLKPSPNRLNTEALVITEKRQLSAINTHLGLLFAFSAVVFKICF